MKHHQWLIIGSFGAGNLGDDAILAGILEALFQVGVRTPVWVSGGSRPIAVETLALPVLQVPHAPSSLWGLLKVNKNIKAWLAFKKADHILIGGGGLFTDQESMRAPKIWGRQTFWLKRWGKHYSMIGQTLGPLKDAGNRERARYALEGANHVQVRDELSEQWAKDLGRGDVALGVDWALPWLLRHSHRHPNANKLTLILRQWPGISAESLQRMTDEVKSYAERRGLEFQALSLDQSEVALEGTNRPRTVEEALHSIAKSKLVISMRLHGALMGLSQQIPTLALSYSPKVENTLDLLRVKTGLKILKPEYWNARDIETALDALLEEPKPEVLISALEKSNHNLLKRLLES